MGVTAAPADSRPRRQHSHLHDDAPQAGLRAPLETVAKGWLLLGLLGREIQDTVHIEVYVMSNFPLWAQYTILATRDIALAIAFWTFCWWMT